MALKENIKKKRKERGMTLEDLASVVGISRQTLSRYETGVIGNIPADKIEKLAKALCTTPAYLMGWEDNRAGNIFSHPDILPIQTEKIPLISGIAFGKPTYAEEDFEYLAGVNTEIKADFALRCRGDSMINIGIKDGYIVFIKSQPSVENGEVAAVNIDGTIALKRFFKYGDIIVLRSENPDPCYRDLVYTEKDVDNFVILGKAIAFQGYVK